MADAPNSKFLQLNFSQRFSLRLISRNPLCINGLHAFVKTYHFPDNNP